MNSTDRKRLRAIGIDPDTLAPFPALAPATPPRPAPATAAPQPVAEWLRGAQVSVVLPDRVYTFASTGTSKSGRPTIVVRTGMSNGGTFESTLPADLCRAIQNGKVLDADGKPHRF